MPNKYNIDINQVDFSKKKFEEKIDLDTIREQRNIPYQELKKIAGSKNIFKESAKYAESEFNRKNTLEISENAFQILEKYGPQPALSYLTILDGVKARTASAILAAYNDKYGIIDDKAINFLQSKGFFNSVEFTQDRDYIRNYDDYIAILKKIVDQHEQIETVREADFILYELGELD
jgi:hypothetical protein